jgi:sodium/potassium-transporting ATPase subunit alpha
VEQGRLIFDNLMKTIAYTLTHLVPELVPVLLNLVVGFPLGLTSLQLLSIDLLTELGPAISVAYEDKESDIMTRPPRNAKTDRLVSIPLLVYSYLCVGILESLGGLTAYFLVFRKHGLYPSDLVFAGDNYFIPDATDNFVVGSSVYTPDQQNFIIAEASAAWYLNIVVCQAFHIWTVKVRRVSIFEHGVRNIVTVLGVCLAVSIMIVFNYVPGVKTILGSEALDWVPWVTAFVTGTIIFGYNELRKYIAHIKPETAPFLIW